MKYTLHKPVWMPVNKRRAAAIQALLDFYCPQEFVVHASIS